MISLDVDIHQCTDWLTDVSERQIPYAASLTLNALAKDVQQGERQHMATLFHINRQQWVDRNVKITHFAKKTELYAEIAIQSPGGGDRSDILAKFEEDTEKTPHAGGKAIVIPVDAGRTKGGILSKNQRPRSFNFQPGKPTKSGAQLYIGERGTILLQQPDGSGLIIQYPNGHTTGQRDGTVLFTLKPRVTIRPELHFEQIGERIVLTKTVERWDEAAAQAMRSAR